MKLRRIATITIAFLFLLLNYTVYGKTANIGSLQTYNRILFVIDSSNSMNYHDNERLVQEIVQMFVDSAHSTKTDIGFITYNDQILNTYPLTPISEMTNRNLIKDAISNIGRAGNTDIGMALNYAMNMFQDNPVQGSNPIIVLISDGETDLTYTRTGRSMADSQADEASAYEKSKLLNCPVYTIGISKDGSLNTEYLKKIADNTGGEAYDIRDSQMLLSAFDTVFSEVTGTDVIAGESIVGTGERQSASFDFPGYHSEETNIIILSRQGIRNVEVDGVFDSSSQYESVNYSSVKVLNPNMDHITINFTAAKDADVKISFINYMDVLPKLTIQGEPSAPEIPVMAKLYSINGDTPLDDALFYAGMTANLFITNKNTGESTTLPMKNTGSGFEVVYLNKNFETNELRVEVMGEGYAGESDVVTVAFTNTNPDTLGGVNARLLKNKPIEYALQDYFSDPDGDDLHYEIIDPSSYESIASLDASMLIVTPKEEGEVRISVRATDGRGGAVLGFFDLEILPFWLYYKTQIITIGCITIVALAIYLLYAWKSKRPEETPPIAKPLLGSAPSFKSAKFEGYFLNTLSGVEIPVLNWSASFIENKNRVSLGDLFAMLDVNEKLPEAYKVFFEAGNNNTVVFYHNTNCIISLGKRTIPSNNKVVLKYDDRLYIVFEDHVTELDIRYKRARRMAMA